MKVKNMRLDAKIDLDDRLMIFGTGQYSKILCNYYGEEHIKRNVDSFVVSNMKGNKEFFLDIPVRTLDDKDNSFKDATLIIALAKHNRYEVESLLRTMFKKVILLEEFMDMSIFQRKISGDRDKEIEDYYKKFLAEKPLFKYIEIETVNRCNGGCSFCPVNRFEKQRPYSKMTERLFCDIIDQLEGLNYCGRLALFSNNEAFLDTRIVDFAKYARIHLPNAYNYITSNGTMLKKEIFTEIIPYLDELNIDLYKSDMMEEDPKNIVDILELSTKLHIENKIKVSRIDEHAIRSSRGGSSPNSKVNYTIKDKCPLLLVQMVIRPDGKVSLCCNDALGKVTLGDLTKESISDVWYGDKYNDMRMKIMKNRGNIDICRFCDYVDMREI